MVLPNGRIKFSPDITPRRAMARASYINACTGLNLQAAEMENGE